MENTPHTHSLKFTDRQLTVIQTWRHIPAAAQAAEHLNISENTYYRHLKRMRQKVNVHRTADVYFYLQGCGLLPVR